MDHLIFGCGYLGRRVAARWLARGDRVWAVTRNPAKARDLLAPGLTPIVADITEPATLSGLPAAPSVLFAVGYDRSSGRSQHEVYVDGLRHVLAALPPTVERFIYISSTGVYGDAHGGVVDETTVCRPERPGGRACLAAEQLLEQHTIGSRSIILRLAGLYGPDRIPRRELLERNEPIDSNPTGWLNLVHVDDAAGYVLAAEEHARLPSLYVISDGAPVVRGDYFAEAARLLGAAPPRFADMPGSSPRGERAAADKRVSSQRAEIELQYHLQYPSYREGLAAAVANASAADGDSL